MLFSGCVCKEINHDLYCLVQSHHNYDLVEHFGLDDVDAAFDLITQVKYNQSIPMRGKTHTHTHVMKTTSFQHVWKPWFAWLASTL